MYLIQETGVANAAIPPEIFVRAVSANNHIVSYWSTVGGVLAVPINPNLLHFTLGVIMGHMASFHSTWLANGAVTYYTCTADAATGALAVAHDVNNPNNVGAVMTLARALAIGPMIYQSVFVDDNAFSEAKKKLAAAQKTRIKTGSKPNRSLFGSALGGTGMGLKPRTPVK